MTSEAAQRRMVDELAEPMAPLQEYWFFATYRHCRPLENLVRLGVAERCGQRDAAARTGYRLTAFGKLLLGPIFSVPGKVSEPAA